MSVETKWKPKTSIITQMLIKQRGTSTEYIFLNTSSQQLEDSSYEADKHNNVWNAIALYML